MQALLMTIGAPLARQILISLGIGIISYGASTILINSIISQIQTQMGGLPDLISQMVSLFGVPESTGILLSAISIRAGVSAAKKMGVL